MSRRLWHLLFRSCFASLVAAVFALFCVFWLRHFAKPVEAATDVGPSKCQNCNGAITAGTTTAKTPKVPPEAQGATKATAAIAAASGDVDSAPPDTTDADADDDQFARALPDLEAKAAATMFSSRIYGPYALSVRDGLNEMVIGSHLRAEGVLGTSVLVSSNAAVLNAIPSQLPTHGYITSGFGTRRSPFNGRVLHHNGVDFAVFPGSPIYATADGIVTHAGPYLALGQAVMLDHGFGIATRYGHNSAVPVHIGDHIRRGDIIARSGNSGRSTGPHLHYEVRINGQPIDPSQFMFEVPEEPLRLATQARSLMVYGKRQSVASSRGLGLPMGGDSEPLAQLGRARAALPTPAERLPLNLAIAFGFFGVALVFLGLAVPKRREFIFLPGCEIDYRVPPPPHPVDL